MTSEGKAAAGTFQAEQKKKVAEAEAKAKKMQADRQRLETGGGVMSPEARTALEKDIERQQREGERYEQDAQAELNELQQKLQAEYNRKLFPVLEQMAKEHGLQLLFSAADAGLIWAEPGLDLTQEAAKRMDAAPTPKPAPATTPAHEAHDTGAAHHAGQALARQGCEIEISKSTGPVSLPLSYTRAHKAPGAVTSRFTAVET